MKLKKLNAAIIAGLAGYSLSLVGASSAFAQEEAVPDDATIEKVAVVGSRGAPRSVTSSPVPVDVLSSDDLDAVPFTDMNDVIKTLVPSYAVSRQPISDGASFIRPATLRGMPSDKILVLVNGKRRHRSALVSIGGSGTQGPDLATIPVAAIGSTEVLRDGAAAQYGSDAIAGVLNFNLKNNSEGGMASLEVGQYYEGDGEQITFNVNKGFALGDDGFLSISGEIMDQKATYRGEEYCESWFCVTDQSEEYQAAAKAMARSIHGSEYVQPWGQPNGDAVRMFFNAGYAISDTMELYSFGNYSDSYGDGSFFYRYDGNGTIEELRQEDGSIYTPLEKFPGGFTPRFSGDVLDYSLAGGLKGEVDSLSYDVSARYGYDEIDYHIWNTINPSMGADSPTKFHPGTLANTEFQLQADFVYDLDDYVVAFGATYMEESYEIMAGDEASSYVGDFATSDPYGFCNDDGTATDAGAAVIAGGSTLDCSDDDDPVYTAVGVGSNGFPGYAEEYTGTYERDMFGIYGDISSDITDSIYVNGAMRYEDYSDFGSKLVGKVSGIVQVTDAWAIRASAGTGFRAPTPGQQGTTNVSTRLPNGFPVATGLFPASSEVAQALGAKELKAESSVNFTLGTTVDLGDFTLTVDAYRIELKDRLNAISTLDVSTDETDTDAYANYLALVDAGVAGAESIGGVFYFQNAFDTITQGVDIVATYGMETSLGDTKFTASINYNEQDFDGDPSEYYNVEAQHDFINGDPNLRGVFSVQHTVDDFSIVARVNYYGEYANANDTSLETIQTFGQEFMFDLEGSYFINDMFTLNMGVRNLFDNYPDKGTMGETCCGRIYRSDSIVDWQGGYYYAKLTAKF